MRLHQLLVATKVEVTAQQVQVASQLHKLVRALSHELWRVAMPLIGRCAMELRSSPTQHCCDPSPQCVDLKAGKTDVDIIEAQLDNITRSAIRHTSGAELLSPEVRAGSHFTGVRVPPGAVTARPSLSRPLLRLTAESWCQCSFCPPA